MESMVELSLNDFLGEVGLFVGSIFKTAVTKEQIDQWRNQRGSQKLP